MRIRTALCWCLIGMPAQAGDLSETFEQARYYARGCPNLEFSYQRAGQLVADATSHASTLENSNGDAQVALAEPQAPGGGGAPEPDQALPPKPGKAPTLSQAECDEGVRFFGPQGSVIVDLLTLVDPDRQETDTEILFKQLFGTSGAPDR